MAQEKITNDIGTFDKVDTKLSILEGREEAQLIRGLPTCLTYSPRFYSPPCFFLKCSFLATGMQDRQSGGKTSRQRRMIIECNQALAIGSWTYTLTIIF